MINTIVNTQLQLFLGLLFGNVRWSFLSVAGRAIKMAYFNKSKEAIFINIASFYIKLF